MSKAISQYLLELKMIADKSGISAATKEFKKATSGIAKDMESSMKQAMQNGMKDAVKRLQEIDKLTKEIEVMELFGNDAEALEEAKTKLEELKQIESEFEGQHKTAEEKAEDEKDAEESREKTIGEGFQSGFKSAFGFDQSPEDMGKTIGSNVASKIQSSIKGVFDKFTKALKNIWDDAIKDLTKIAEYSSSSSKFNEDVADMKEMYGLSDEQAYATTQALKAAGLDSVEDYFDNQYRLSEEQNETLLENYEVALKQYNAAEETALAYQEFQKEYSLFKEELELELINFFMENEELIKNALTAAVKVLEVLISLVGWVTSSSSERTDSARKQATADILGTTTSTSYQVANSTSTTSNNIKIDNTFNGISSDAQSQISTASDAQMKQLMNIFNQ